MPFDRYFRDKFTRALTSTSPVNVRFCNKVHYPVPGYIGDNNYRCFNKFDKWYKLPRSAHRLYWKTHDFRNQS